MLDVHPLRFVQFVLKLYAAVVCSNDHASAGDVIVRVHAVASLDDAAENVNVGAIVSILIVLPVVAERHNISVA